MTDHFRGNALLQTTPAELVRHAGSIVKKAAEEFGPLSQGLDRWHARAWRMLFVADPMEAPTSFVRHLLRGPGVRLDITPGHDQSKPDNVYERLNAITYDLLIPSNLGLSPGYIPALVSFTRQRQSTLKILVISGWNSPEFFQDLNTRGIHDYVLLPMRAEDLQERIFRLLPGYSGQGG
jgi:response regulator RpfG family c-di-GMP phosphodiesterase